VTPVYNEEAIITDVLNKWTKELQRLKIDYQIHVYDDGSKDNTLQILKRISCENQNIIVHNKLNSGHGPTIIQGYRENSVKKWIFQMDSDDEIAPESFENLWAKRCEYDLLIGRRNRPHQPFTRKLISFVSRLVVRTFYGNKVYDVNSPYRLIRTERFRNIFHALPDNMFAPNLVISGVASLKNMDVYEIPVKQHERTTGVTSIRSMALLKGALKSLIQTIRFRFESDNKCRS